MGFYCPHADPKGAGRFFVGFSFGQELNDLLLAASQSPPAFAVVMPVALVAIDDLGKQDLGNLRCEIRLVPGERFDRSDQTLEWFGLEDEALHSNLEGFPNQAVGLMLGEHEDLNV